MNTSFRATTTTETFTERDVESTPESKNTGESTSLPIEPVKDPEQAVLKVLGVADDPKVMPADDREKLSEASRYVQDVLKTRGVTPSEQSFREVIDELRLEMGLDSNAEPSMVLDRIGGVAKAWKEISFISDPREKKALFMKLAQQPDSKAMNKLVLEEMNKHEIWR